MAVTQLLITEATRQISHRSFPVETPLAVTTGIVANTRVLVLPILRAGLGMLDVALSMLPDAVVGYVGLERNHETAIASSYYQKLPEHEGIEDAYVLDPMLATGGSALHALRLVTELRKSNVYLINIVAAPEGVRAIEEAFPHVNIVTAALDTCLDSNRYIVPGLGDFGDRLYGTG